MSKEPLINQLDEAIMRMFADPDAPASSVDPEVVELLSIARDLHGMPNTGFKGRLKEDLSMRAIMMSTKTVEFRPGFRTITPYLLPRGLEFIDFLKRVFHAEETFRAQAGPDRFHAEVRVGDSMLMVGVGSDRKMPAAMQVYVPDVDEVCKRAIDAGCVELEPPSDRGDRFGCVRDQEGNDWVIATHPGESYIPKGRNSITVTFVVKGAGRFIDFLTQAFAADEIQRRAWRGGLHALVNIGNSTVGVSESTNHKWMRPMTTMINMYVPDCETVYEAALRAGAKSIAPVSVQPYGVRSGAIEDAWGNQWFIATPL